MLDDEDEERRELSLDSIPSDVLPSEFRDKLAAYVSKEVGDDGIGFSIHESSYEHHFAGLLPHPETFVQYDPDAKQLMLNIARQRAEHDMKMEADWNEECRRDMRASRLEKRIGQFFAFGIGITGIVAGAYVIVATNGAVAASIGGTVLAGGVLVSLVTVFIAGRPPERDKKSQTEPKPVDEDE